MGFTHGDYGCIATKESKGRAQECRDLHLGQEVENEGADTCEKQGGAHRETGNYRNQNGGSEHGEHVLEAEGKHLARSKLTGIVDSLLILSHMIWFV